MHKKIFIVIIIIAVFCLTAGTALAAPPSSATTKQTSAATLVTAFVAVIFLSAAIILAVRHKTNILSEQKSNYTSLFIFIAGAVALRVIISLTYPGYGSDMGCFKGWATAAFENGPANFYTSGMFADYPPGYMYVLWVLGFIRNIFNLDSSGSLFTLIIKTPSIIAEVITAVIVYRIGTKHIGKSFGLLCSILILFNPAMFFNSSAWGQIDAVFVLFIVLTLLYLKKENYLLGAFFYALCMLIKPQAILFAPVVGLAYLYSLFKKGTTGKAVLNILGSAAVFAGIIFAASLPFKGTQSFDWIVHKYIASTQTYDFSTLNAFNLYAMTGANFESSNMTFFLGLSYETWGIIFIVAICITVIVLQWRTRAQRPLFDLSAFLIMSVYMLAHAMHERYIMPVPILLIFAYLFTRDSKTLFFASAFTITALLAEMFTLYSDSVVAPQLPTIIVSAVNMALYLAYAFITTRKYTSNKFLIRTPAMHG